MIWGLVLVALAAATSARADDLTPQQRRGQQIFERGESGARQKITAILGNEDAAVPATVAPCANCHGADGRSGTTESGITPPDITWDHLTRSYGGTPYTERLVRRAVSLGINSAGGRLYNAMPRYQMQYADMDDLLAYLKVVGTLAERGITDDEVQVGFILPPKGNMTAAGQAVQAALTAYFSDVNAGGGVYSRRIVLHASEPPVAKFLDAQPLFALVSSFLAGSEREVTELLRERRRPLVGAFTLFPQLEQPLNPFVFYFYPGVPGEADALVKFASREGNDGLAVVHGSEKVFAGTAESVAPSIRRFEVSDVAHTARALADASVKTVLFLMPAATAAALIREMAALKLTVRVLMPGSLASDEALKAVAETKSPAWLAMPTLPGSAAPEALAEYRRLAARYGLSTTSLPAQHQAIASAKVLVEGLKQAGRQVTAARLVAALEELRDFAPTLGPAVTFGPNRRVGVSGMRIVPLP